MTPKGLEATAQSIWSMGSSLGGIILSYVFGLIINKYGIMANYTVGLVLQLSWVAIFIFTLLFGRFILKKKNAVPMFFNDKNNSEMI